MKNYFQKLSYEEELKNKVRIEKLREKGVYISDHYKVFVSEDVEISNIEEGAVIVNGFILGPNTMIGKGAIIGYAGNVTLVDSQLGENVEIYAGIVENATFLDNVKLRGWTEVRGGTLLEEGSEGAHNVGFKMTILAPYVVAGSLINFCDLYMAGGTSRINHSEIGSGAIHYNFDPRGDKWASLIGDVPKGVFLREKKIFIGGQTKIVGPVKIGYGAIIAAGSPVRKNVNENFLYSEKEFIFQKENYDTTIYGDIISKFDTTLEYIGNMHALYQWYKNVRILTAFNPFQEKLYFYAQKQIKAHIEERVKKLASIINKLKISIEKSKSLGNTKYISQHEYLINNWDKLKEHLLAEFEGDKSLKENFLTSFKELLNKKKLDYIQLIQLIDEKSRINGINWLKSIVNNYSIILDATNFPENV